MEQLTKILDVYKRQGVLFLAGGQTGTLILDPMVSEPNELVNLMQVNFLQPVYNLSLIHI